MCSLHIFVSWFGNFFNISEFFIVISVRVTCWWPLMLLFVIVLGNQTAVNLINKCDVCSGCSTHFLFPWLSCASLGTQLDQLTQWPQVFKLKEEPNVSYFKSKGILKAWIDPNLVSYIKQLAKLWIQKKNSWEKLKMLH
jgi:hypothetical protein